MGFVLTKTNQHLKYESSMIKCFQDNERKPFGHRQMDGQTDGQKDKRTLAKQYAPSS